MAKIESAFLDSDQEQKLNNILNFAEARGGKVDIRKIQVSPEFKKIRGVLAGLQAQAYLCFYGDRFGFNAREIRIITEFALVARDIMQKSQMGELEFVAEKDEK